MEDIVKLEEFIGSKVEDWTVQSLSKLSECPELFQIFKKSDVMKELLTRSRNNRDIADMFVPLYIKSQLTDAEEYANDILKAESEKQITRDELQVKLIEMINMESFYYVLSGYLILISMFPEYDCKKEEIVIKENISNMKEVVIGFIDRDLESTYSLIQDLLELIFPLRARYYEKYKDDILDDEDGRLYAALQKLQEFELKIQQELLKLSANMTEMKDLEAILEAEENPKEGEANE